MFKTVAKALDYNYEMPDVLALMMGAFMTALRWIGVQYLLQVIVAIVALCLYIENFHIVIHYLIPKIYIDC